MVLKVTLIAYSFKFDLIDSVRPAEKNRSAFLNDNDLHLKLVNKTGEESLGVPERQRPASEAR
jgi:hypothetical protein